jgi:DNA-nicking Smr family endonuclease
MSFEEIFDNWERKRGKEQWEELKKSKDLDSAPGFAPKRSELRKMEPQDSIDLHGMDSGSAEAALAAFLSQARSRGLKKVLIIHGKGNHSAGDPVLEKMVRNYLEKCSFTGETGKPGRDLGGGGATWVLLKLNAPGK